jgi:hypothetical protein
MEVVRLGEYNNDDPTYLPDMIIEGYTSMIWTERYLEPGEFILTTPYIDETYDALPEMTLISHRETRETMIVESHLITLDENGNEELTITGRSVDCMLQSRFLEAQYQKKRKMAMPYTDVDAAMVLIWNSIDNVSGYDVTRERKDADPDDDEYHDGDRWPWSDKDAIPNVAVSDSTVRPSLILPSWGDAKRWWVREGLMYEQLIKILDQADLGIRTMRPPTPIDFGSQRVRVHYGLGDIGEVVREEWGTYNQLRFDVFQGQDRTVDQDHYPSVVFDVLRGDFEKSSNLWSTKDWKTELEILSGLNLKRDIYRDDQAGLTGWERRSMLYDAGTPELPDKPDADVDDYATKIAHWRDRRDVIYAEFEEDYDKDGLRELNKYKKIALFSGDISPDASLVYNVDYVLGDKVSLRGRRGLKASARVHEYVRTDDIEGDRGYPGFATP